MVEISTIVTPARVQPGKRVRVRVVFRLNAKTTPWWNNEADRLTLSLKLPDGVTAGEGTFVHSPPRKPETKELRVLEFELSTSADLPEKPLSISAYATYGVCEDKGGICMYLRQDFKVTLQLDSKAPKLGR